MTVRVDLSGSDLSDAEIEVLAEELQRELADGAGLRPSADPAAPPAEAGAKGDPITLGVLVYAAVKSGVAQEMVKAISTFVSRSKKIRVEVEKDGKKVVIDAENVSKKTVAGVVDEVQRLLED